VWRAAVDLTVEVTGVAWAARRVKDLAAEAIIAAMDKVVGGVG